MIKITVMVKIIEFISIFYLFLLFFLDFFIIKTNKAPEKAIIAPTNKNK